MKSFRLPHAPSQAETIFPAPDGSFWLAVANGVPGEPRRYVLGIERLTPTGEFSPIADHLEARGFARTADGSVWFTGNRFVGRFTGDGVLTKFPLPEDEASASRPVGDIVLGADGNLWFPVVHIPQAGSESPGEAAFTIDRMTPTGQIDEFALPALAGVASHVVAGGDGSVWFTARDKVGRIRIDGQVTEFPLPRYSGPYDIAAGPDGSVWFTETVERQPAIGRMTPAGQLTHFPLPVSQEAAAGAIAAGPDGRLWFAFAPGVIGRIDTDGRISRVELPDGTYVGSIVAGAEGNVWYTAEPEPPCAEGDEACRLALPTAAGIVGSIAPAPLAARVEAGRPVAGGRRVRIRVACVDGLPSQVCRGLLGLRLRGAVIGRRRFRLAADRSRDFVLALSRGARTRLLDTGHLKVLCTVAIPGRRARARVLRLKLAVEGVGPGEPLGPGRGR